jgi:hypothetical protein
MFQKLSRNFCFDKNDSASNKSVIKEWKWEKPQAILKFFLRQFFPIAERSLEL